MNPNSGAHDLRIEKLLKSMGYVSSITSTQASGIISAQINIARNTSKKRKKK